MPLWIGALFRTSVPCKATYIWCLMRVDYFPRPPLSCEPCKCRHRSPTRSPSATPSSGCLRSPSSEHCVVNRGPKHWNKTPYIYILWRLSYKHLIIKNIWRVTFNLSLCWLALPYRFNTYNTSSITQSFLHILMWISLLNTIWTFEVWRTKNL